MEFKSNFTSEDWERTRNNWSAWWENELDRPLVVIERIEGYDLAPELTRDVNPRAITFPLGVPAEEVIDFYSEHLANPRYFGDAFPRFFADFGPGIADMSDKENFRCTAHMPQNLPES